jgi:hypothetical protein
MLKSLIISFFKKKKGFLKHDDISKLVKMDKAKLSGYLDAMVDYGDLSVEKAGNTKLFFLNDNDKEKRLKKYRG